MPARFMLDTNIIIFIRSAKRVVVEHFDTLSPGEAVMSVISYGELLFGAERSQSRERALGLLGRVIAAIPVEGLRPSVAAHYAEIRFHLGRHGEIIGGNDLWIAAHARAAGLTLVTNNEREFRRVPGLSVENWAEAA